MVQNNVEVIVYVDSRWSESGKRSPPAVFGSRCCFARQASMMVFMKSHLSSFQSPKNTAGDRRRERQATTNPGSGHLHAMVDDAWGRRWCVLGHLVCDEVYDIFFWTWLPCSRLDMPTARSNAGRSLSLSDSLSLCLYLALSICAAATRRWRGKRRWRPCCRPWYQLRLHFWDDFFFSSSSS